MLARRTTTAFKTAAAEQVVSAPTMVSLQALVAVSVKAAAVALLASVTLTAVRARARPSAAPFATFSGSLTVWAGATYLGQLPEVVLVGPTGALLGLASLGGALAVPATLAFYALSYTGRGVGLTWRRGVVLVLLAVPVFVATVVVGALGPDSGVVPELLRALLVSEVSLLVVLFVYAVYLLVGHARSRTRVSMLQVGMVLAAATAPLFGSDSASAVTVLDGEAWVVLASGVLLTVAVRMYPVLTGFPKANHVARSRLVEDLQEAVLVLDWDDHVLDVNESAGRLFGFRRADVVGEPLGDHVAGLAGRSLPAGDAGTVGLQTTAGRREFRYSVSAVGASDAGDSREAARRRGPSAAIDSARDPVSRVLLLRDVTDRETRGQRLTVLNRVLRHNLRNGLDVVLAHADHVEDADTRASIRSTTSDLLAVADKARAAEECMAATTDPPESVDLAAVAASVAEQHRERAGDLTVDAPDSLVVESHRPVLERVVSELVDNAVTHTDDPDPTVEITARTVDGPQTRGRGIGGGGGRSTGEGATGQSGETVEIAVSDDGPGIPQHERDVIDAGTEAQLQHGSGIGLWFVDWAVTQLGGDLSFGESTTGGSRVSVRLYRAVDHDE
ncbi:ATP-binding protein [Halobacterium rubrum]|uniref:ATP-binding protein n=1 Tax=Halobacterium TaxID=2239 RepID=UPI001F1CFA02|nr:MULTISPECIES: ATP-binding protein [Halobacterium]MDH5020782.1 ATP-binding protein [Halobacterium rubrum]